MTQGARSTRGLYDRDDVRELVSRLRVRSADASALHAAMGRDGRPACRPRRSSRRRGMFARGPSCFISGHGIDAASNGVQTFRCLLLPVRDQRQRRSRPAGNRRPKRPAGLQDLFRHPVRSGLPALARDRGAAHRRGAVPAVGGPARLPDGLPQPFGHRGDPDRRPYPVRALYASRREHRGDLSGHGTHDRRAEEPRPLRGRGAPP